VKLYLPLQGQSAVQPKFISLPGRGKQFNIRPYTIRRFDPEALELDIDVLLHGDSPGSVWARTVQPGDAVGFIGPRHDYRVPADVEWQLLVGDESALPAIAAVLESLPAGARAYAWIEVNDAADELPIETKAEVHLSWLHRGRQSAASSGLLEQNLRSFTLPAGKGHIWMAGHAQTAKNIRRHLLEERQLSKDVVTTMGYWR
jgi:NADPH-dependent ferric siderophore reductase